MIGFLFNGKHSSDFGLIFKSIDRTVLPPLKRRDLDIPGRHGRYDFEDNKYDNRTISVSLTTIRRSLPELRQQVRLISGWLKGKGELIFDDEPDKHYVAKIYDQIGLEQFAYSGTLTAVFECEPFAYSVTQTTEVTLTDNSQTFIYNNGTIETPHEITITNLGANTINGFRIKIIKNR